MPPSRTALRTLPPGVVPKLVPGVVPNLVVGIVLGLVLGGCGGADAPGWEPYESSVSAPPDLAEQCPDPTTPLPYPGGDELPAGAVAVRLCNGPDPTGGADAGLLFAPPVDLLETGVDDLVAIVDALEPVELDGQACDGDLGATSVFWFLYADQDPRAVSLQHYGCGNTFVAPDQAGAGGEALLATFDARLWEQRAGRTPPGDRRVPSCEPLASPAVSPLSLTHDGLDLATAVYCTTAGRAVLAPGQVERLSVDLRVPPRPRAGCPPQTGRRDGGSTIAARTVWGDVVVLHGRCSTYPAQTGLVDADGEPSWWVLSPGVRRMLAALPLR